MIPEIRLSNTCEMYLCSKIMSVMATNIKLWLFYMKMMAHMDKLKSACKALKLKLHVQFFDTVKTTNA